LNTIVLPTPHPSVVTEAAVPANQAPPRQQPRWRRRLGLGLLWLVALGVMLVVLAWAAGQWLILPNLDRWRTPIEQQASQALGLPVKIGTLRVQTEGLLPRVALGEVVLQDANQQEALRLSNVTAALSARTLWSGTPQLDDVVVDGAQLTVRRDAQGHVWVAGFNLHRPAPGGEELNADGAWRWLLQQPSLAVRNATVRWVDEKRAAPPLALTAVNISLKNRGAQHALSLAATPPPAWGDAFTARVDLQGSDAAGAAAGTQVWLDQAWSGELHLQVPRADVAQLRQYLTLPTSVQQGRGSVTAAATLTQGRWVAATADVDLQDVGMRMAADLEPLAFKRLQTRLQTQRSAATPKAPASNELTLQGLTFTTMDGVTWPRGDVRVQLLGDPSQPEGGSLQAQRVDLAVLSLVASRLPLGPELRPWLAKLQPQGLAERLEAQWAGAVEAPKTYRVKASLSGLQLSPSLVPLAARAEDQVLGRPGLRGGNVDFEATQDGGNATVAMTQGSLSFPGVFERPEVALDRLNAQVQWRITPAVVAAADGAAQPLGISVTVTSAQFANADAQGELQGTWHTGPGEGMGLGKRFPGQLDVSGKLTRGRATAVGRYLPLGLAREVRQYVAGAVVDGRITDASFKVQGDLKQIPFPRGTSSVGKAAPIFLLRAAVTGGSMNLAPNAVALAPERAHANDGAKGTPLWPLITDITGELAFDRTTMTIRNAQGRVEGLHVRDLQGGIADLTQSPTVMASGVAHGRLQDMLSYVKRSPIGGWIGNSLATTTATGSSDLTFTLNAPIQALERTKVQGRLPLTGHDLRMRPDTPLLAQVQGMVQFSESGMTVQDGRATVFGGEATIAGGTRADGSMHFDAQGNISAQGLSTAKELGSVSSLAALMKGEAAYRLALTFQDGQPFYTVTSALRGMAIDAPAPMGKPADAEMALVVQSAPVAAAPATVGPKGAKLRRDTLHVALGNVLQANYVRELTADEPRVVAGAVGVGTAAPTPMATRGVQAAIQADVLDVDAWLAVARVLKLNVPGEATAPSSAAAVSPAAAGVVGAAGASAASGGYMPTQVTVRAPNVIVDSRRMTGVRAQLSQIKDDGTWLAKLEAEQAAGEVQWRPARAGMAPHVQARFARLSIPAAATISMESMLTTDAPSQPPSLDIEIDDFELKGRKLGRVEVDATHERDTERSASAPGAADVTTWRLNRLRVTSPDAQLTGTGRWTTTSPLTRRMVLDFSLKLEDGGSYLSRYGFPELLRGGQGLLTGQISWAGSPLALHVPSLAGRLNLKLDDGQFLKADAGAARLLGVLSLQSLPRRLLLDFRDLFSDGFAFDNIGGDVVIAEGQASTNNLRMRGVQAAVLMSGRADMVKETQNLDVWVVPEINAGTASLVYAAINPAVGLGTFLAQLFLRRPLMEAGTRKFSVKGAWADPQVERVERPAGDRVPQLDEAGVLVPVPEGAASPALVLPTKPTPATTSTPAATPTPAPAQAPKPTS
jgi:uncharacterized protein (TIGR02099 family)